MPYRIPHTVRLCEVSKRTNGGTNWKEVQPVSTLVPFRSAVCSQLTGRLSKSRVRFAKRLQLLQQEQGQEQGQAWPSAAAKNFLSFSAKILVQFSATVLTGFYLGFLQLQNLCFSPKNRLWSSDRALSRVPHHFLSNSTNDEQHHICC